MKPSIVAKLEALHERHEEVQALLGDAQTIADQERFRALSREYAQLSDVSRCFTDWQQVQEDIETAQMMLDDPEMREMAQDELREAKEKSEQLEQQLQVLLLPKDPDDERNAFLEVRAGTGGDEAALFAGDLFRMYSRYAEARQNCLTQNCRTSTQQICALILSAPQGRVVSTLTPPIRQFVLLTCRPGLLLNVRTNVHNIKTKLKHFLYLVLASTLQKWQNGNRPKRLHVVTCWGVAIAAIVTVLTISRRGALPITAST